MSSPGFPVKCISFIYPPLLLRSSLTFPIQVLNLPLLFAPSIGTSQHMLIQSLLLVTCPNHLSPSLTDCWAQFTYTKPPAHICTTNSFIWPDMTYSSKNSSFISLYPVKVCDSRGPGFTAIQNSTADASIIDPSLSPESNMSAIFTEDHTYNFEHWCIVAQQRLKSSSN